MKKDVTLNDIAKACGTSSVTVSKALADKKGMSEELRQKIKKTAKEMGYVAIHIDSRRRDNRIVGVLIPEKFMNPNGSFYWALYNALANKLKRRGFFCIIEMLTEDEEKNLSMPRLLTEKKTYSVISLGQLTREYVQKLNETASEMLMLDYYHPDLEIDSVVTNGYVGGYELASYLIRRGHRDIGFIGTVRATSSIFDRYMGYSKALMENGLEVRPEWTLDDRNSRDFVDIDFGDSYPTAYVCNCDEAAYNAIRCLKKRGIRVPEDISIVGYDNYLISDICEPAITTINVDSELMAEEAVNLMISRIIHPDKPIRRVTITGKLIEKDSVQDITKTEE